MKQVIILTLLLFASFVGWAYDFSAVTTTGQMLYYNIVDNSVIVTYPHYYQNDYWHNCIQPTGDLVVPDLVYYQGHYYDVVSIGTCAFSGCGSLTSVTIPSSVRTVAESAFRNCVNLENVNLPSSLIRIGDHSFSGCTSLSNIVIPDSVSRIEQYAFYSCSSLGNVTIPNSISFIGNYAFSDCTNLSYINIPNSVTVIGENAFRWVKYVSYCGSTTDWYPWGARIAGCLYEEDDFVYQDETKTYLRAYMGDDSCVVVPNTVTRIGKWAFFGCSCISSITIPSSVNSIEDYAFSGCDGVSRIVSEAVEAPGLGANPFYNMNYDISIIIPCGSESSYSEEWIYFSNFIETYPYEIEVHPEDIAKGIVQVLVQPTCDNNGESVVCAIPQSGYVFSRWSNGLNSNPLSVSLASDTSIVAYFEINNNQGVDLIEPDVSIEANNGVVAINGAEGKKLMIYDVNGRTIIQDHILNNTYNNHIHPGIYFVKIGNHRTRKIIVR